MEFNNFMSILRGKLWLLILPLVITVGAMIVFLGNQPIVAEATTTLVSRPNPEISLQKEIVEATNVLSNRLEINATFALIAESARIKTLAAESLNLDASTLSSFVVQAEVVPGTNVIEIIVQGQSPSTVVDFANAIGDETVTYVRNLYDVFELQSLDRAQNTINPGPSVGVLVAISIILGLILGIGLVVFSEYLQRSG